MSIPKEQIEAGARALMEVDFGTMGDQDRWMTRPLGDEYRRRARAVLATLEPQGDETCSTCGAAKPEENVFCSNAYHVPELAAFVRTPDDIRELGSNPKLDELIVLAAVAAASESGNGYDLSVLRRHANRAASLWYAQLPVAEALRPFADALDEWGDDPEVGDDATLWEHPLGMCITTGDFRRAKAAITAIGSQA